jgi:hypothetical protein
MTPALIVVFKEPLDESSAENVLAELEPQLEEAGVLGHIEHATVSRCFSLIQQLETEHKPTLGEASAVMHALVAYAKATGIDEPEASAMPALLDELAGAVRRLRAVTS